jgi:hypothetical protein
MSVLRCSWLPRLLLGILAGSFTLLAEPRCVVCDRVITGDTFFTTVDRVDGEKKAVCAECQGITRLCALCRLPVKINYTEVGDGRYLCARDAKTVITDPDQALRVCQEARGELDRLFARFMTFPSTNVVLRIVDQVHMDELANQPGFERQCPLIGGYTRSVTMHDGGWKHPIAILSAMPRQRLMAVYAHELAHAWTHENLPAERLILRDSAEGFCELIACRLMEQLRETNEVQYIKSNNYTRGQIVLFLEAYDAYDLNRILDWMKYGEDDRLFPADLDRIRRIDTTRQTARVSRPANAGPPPAAALTPVPDQLTLVGISGTGKRRLALINDRALAENEEAKVRVGETNVTIRCVEIRVDSVVIQVVGAEEKQELPLRKK